MVEAVVTVFARNDGEVLLQRIADRGGRWDGISQDIEDDPKRSAMEAIFAVFEHAHAASVTRTGDPARTERGIVHPVLVDVPDRALVPDAPLEEAQWRHASDILAEGSEAGLWTAYRHVGPTPETVLADRSRGSTTLSIRALEALRDRSAELARVDGDPDGWETIAGLANPLATARPELTALVTRVDRAMARANGAVTALESICREEIERALDADEKAAQAVSDRSTDATVLSLSRSETVQQALTRGSPSTVLLLESRPGYEAIQMGESLARDGFDVTLTLDAGVGDAFARGEIDLVLVGADTITPDGTLHNKVGTRTVTVLANAHDTPVVVVSAADKIAQATPRNREYIDREELYDGAEAIAVECPLFDRTEPGLIDAVVTDQGPLDGDEIAAIAAGHRANREWRNAEGT